MRPWENEYYNGMTIGEPMGVLFMLMIMGLIRSLVISNAPLSMDLKEMLEGDKKMRFKWWEKMLFHMKPVIDCYLFLFFLALSPILHLGMITVYLPARLGAVLSWILTGVAGIAIVRFMSGTFDRLREMDDSSKYHRR